MSEETDRAARQCTSAVLEFEEEGWDKCREIIRRACQSAIAEKQRDWQDLLKELAKVIGSETYPDPVAIFAGLRILKRQLAELLRDRERLDGIFELAGNLPREGGWLNSAMLRIYARKERMTPRQIIDESIDAARQERSET